VERLVVEGAAGDAVYAGVDETQVPAGILVGQGDHAAQRGALALVPPLPLMR